MFLFAARMKKFQSKMKMLSPIASLWGFFSLSRAANSTIRSQMEPNFELVQDIMVVLLTCKNEEDPNKKGSTRVPTRLYFNFSDAQGQLTLQSVVEYGRNSNSSKLLWLSSLPARMKKTQSKMKTLECKQHFSNY